MVMLHNKLKGMEHRAPRKHIFYPYTHPQHVVWIIRKKSECGHAAYRIKGREVQTNIESNTLTLHTPLASGSGYRLILKLYRFF